jgi:hypothetical protein
MDRAAATVRLFAPEHWGETDKFSKLHFKTYTFTKHETKALQGVTSHFGKAVILRRLCEKLTPNLDFDNAELVATGYSPTHNSREFSAVFEACIAELYSSLDCCVKILKAIYSKKTRGFKNSTRWLFQNFEKLSDGFPSNLKGIFETAEWYPQLLVLRDELTHLETGSCHLDDKTGKIKYMHTGIEVSGQVFVLEDVIAWLEIKIQQINEFLGRIFHHLNYTLTNENVLQLCGFGAGRVYTRMVTPTEVLTKDSGSCLSHSWF